MNYLNHPTARALAAGLAAALTVLAAAYASGEGVSTAEWITTALAALTAVFGVQTVRARRELQAVRHHIDNVTAPFVKDTRQRVSEMESMDLVQMDFGATPPEEGVGGTVLWMDTSIANNAVLKYWDGNEWVRMDGGGDIPNGRILGRHLSQELQEDLGLAANANLSARLSKLVDEMGTGFRQVSERYAAADEALGGRIDADHVRATEYADGLARAAVSLSDKRFDHLASRLSELETALAAQDADANRRGSSVSEAELIGAVAAESELRAAAVTAETTRATAAEAALDGRLDTLEGVDNLTQAEFNTFNTALDRRLISVEDVLRHYEPRTENIKDKS